MRVMMASIVLAGGLLTLGGCSTSADAPALTLAERTELCRRAGVKTIPTGRETGDARQDYRCGVGHRHINDFGDRNI